jgi:hypothetical protein
MLKYFLKVSFTLLFLTLFRNIVFAQVKLISPYNGEILEDTLVHFKWENTDPNMEYVYQLVTYINGSLDNTRSKVSLGSDEEYTWVYVDNRFYFWEVRYERKESFNGYYNQKTEVFAFGLNTEVPDSVMNTLNEYNNPPQEEEEGNEEEESKESEEEEETEGETEVEEVKGEEEIKEEEEKIKEEEEIDPTEEKTEETPKVEKKVEEVSKPTTEVSEKKKAPVTIKTQPPPTARPSVQEEDYNWNIKNSSVLGVSKNENKDQKKILCKFKYNKKDNSFETLSCEKSRIEISKEQLYPFLDEYSLYIEGNVTRDVNIQVDTYDCVKDIFKPKTWFKCEEKFLGSEVIEIRPHMFFRINQNGSDVPVRSFSPNGDSFRLLAGYTRKNDNFKLTHTYRIINGKYNIFYDLKTEIPLNPKIISDSDILTKENSSKPFRFPFNKIIGVTQWYGFTDYQSPHTGIDFGATKEKVVSAGDGVVVGKGWDSYFGECLSGGNFLKVKHSNGMYTTYFHLEDMYVNTGDTVKKGQIIAKSGNTGAWNCQKLGYHLHFETRLNSSSKSHTNPVPYIDTDWNKVLTLGSEYNPGRLSGENPHPGR